MIAHLVASIPSPSSGTIGVGGLRIHAYGLMIALGVVAAVWLFGRRLAAIGAGTPDDASAIAVWAVVAGVIGARLYHVATDWSSFQHDLGKIPQIWKGGLGIPGGLLAGIAVGLWAGNRRGIPAAVAADCAAPALPLAQAIGRWGNWFNQELFGKATTLPWGLKVSDANTISAGYPPGTTFHPTFLYESLWNFGLCALLLAIDRRWKVPPPRLMAIYIFGYAVGRFWVEGLRIDPAHHVGGMRWNQWVALVVAVAAAAYLAGSMRRLPAPATVGDDDEGWYDDDDGDDDGHDAEGDADGHVERDADGHAERDDGDGERAEWLIDPSDSTLRDRGDYVAADDEHPD